jgi:cyclophilin family peptidyl-prolyl cis-trans isomerase
VGRNDDRAGGRITPKGTQPQPHLRERAAAASGRRKVVAAVAALSGVAIILGGVVSMTGTPADDTTTTTSTTVAGSGEAADLPRPPEGITLDQATPCPPAEGTARRVEVFAGPPPTCIDPAASYTATFDTTEGSFTATLDAATAPVTVNNFVVLARYRYYDGVPFHRIVPGFVIQAGDGDGEPWGNNDTLGYTVPDELPASSAAYTDHSLAMANAGPDTNGSQFFVVLPGGGAQLQPAYSWFGQVTEGTDVVDRIGGLGNDAQEPTEAVVIESVTITERPPAG